MSKRSILFLFLPLILLIPCPAFGYVDPGSGSFIYQVAYAAVLGVTFSVRKLISRIWRKRR